MTTSPFRDAVSIDTNIFEHLLNPQINLDGHINTLLVHLQEQGIALLVDDRNRISGEYNDRIGPIIRNSDEGNEVYILRYWILNALRVGMAIDRNGRLMSAIRRVIVEQSGTVDRIFVYVALSQGKVLISNDGTHIVFGTVKDRQGRTRRQRLLSNTRKLRPQGADILTSQEAHERIPKP